MGYLYAENIELEMDLEMAITDKYVTCSVRKTNYTQVIKSPHKRASIIQLFLGYKMGKISYFSFVWSVQPLTSSGWF